MAWISVHEDVKGPKLRKLAKEIGVSKAEALGILNFLWLFGLHNADQSGKLLEAEREDIEDELDQYTSAPVEKVVGALFKTGWLDDNDGRIIIHDWDVWQEQWYKAIERRKKDAERKKKERAKASGKAVDDGQISIEGTQEEEAPPPLPKDEPNHELVKPKYSGSFETFWAAYPKHVEKGGAYKKYLARLNDGFSENELLLAAQRYAEQCARNHTELKYIKQGKTFLGDATPFTDFLPKKEEPQTSFEPDDSNPFAEYGQEEMK